MPDPAILLERAHRALGTPVLLRGVWDDLAHRGQDSALRQRVVVDAGRFLLGGRAKTSGPDSRRSEGDVSLGRPDDLVNL